MNITRDKLQATDIIALVIITGGIILKLCGADGLVGTLMTAVVFYYFGERYSDIKNEK